MNCARCDEILETDGIEPDCENCDIPVLRPANAGIIELYQLINTQFVYDFHAIALVFEVFHPQCSRAEAREMLEKLISIHGITKEYEDEKRKQKSGKK